LINKYDRFIITRSDFIYQLPHPKVEYMDENFIWVPDGENYGYYAITDRHAILSKNTIIPYLNMLNNMVIKSNLYFSKMKNLHRVLPDNEISYDWINNKDSFYRKVEYEWCLEKFINFHLEQNNLEHLLRHFPYIMYSARSKNINSTWAFGTYHYKLGYYIKYWTEYLTSEYHRLKFIETNINIDEWYMSLINIEHVNNKRNRITSLSIYFPLFSELKYNFPSNDIQ